MTDLCHMILTSWFITCAVVHSKFNVAQLIGAAHSAMFKLLRNTAIDSDRFDTWLDCVYLVLHLTRFNIPVIACVNVYGDVSGLLCLCFL